MLTDEGRFSMAAKYHKDIAEICENDLSDNKQAAAHYERAAELYEGEPNSSSYDTLAWRLRSFHLTLQWSGCGSVCHHFFSATHNHCVPY